MGNIETLNEISKSVDTYTWSLWFVLFIGACWAPVYNRNSMVAMYPRWGIFKHAATPAPASALDMLPRTKGAAWQLGHLAGLAEALTSRMEAGKAPLQPAEQVLAQLAELTSQAADILGVPHEQVTPDLLQRLGSMISDSERPNSTLARLKGLFTFASFMWMIGILGVAISFGPAAIALFGPVIDLLLAWALNVARVMHALARPFYPGLGLYVCSAIVTAAQFQPAPAASRLAFVGVVLATVGFISCLAAHAPPNPPPFPDATILVNGFALLCLGPLAHVFNSELMGFFAVAALFGALGFSVIPLGLGVAVGWASRDTMMNTAAASSVLVSLLLAARAWLPDAHLIKPFQLGLSVFGSITLLLAGLIRSSRYYSTRGAEAWLGYHPSNWLYVLLVLGMSAAGSLLGFPSMVASGSTFFVLWILDKVFEACLVQGLGWVAVLLVSLGMCGCGWWIHTHPGWLARMLSL